MNNELMIKIEDEWIELNGESGITGLYVDMNIKKITIEGSRGTIIDYFISKAYDANPDKDVIYNFCINGNILKTYLSDLRTEHSALTYNEETESYEETFFKSPIMISIILTII